MSLAIWKSDGSFLSAGSQLSLNDQLTNYNTFITGLWFTNPTTAAIAVTVTDANGAPLIPGTAVVPNGRLCLEDTYASGGVIITAAQSGLWFGGCWRAMP